MAFIQLAKVKIQNTEAGQKLFLLILGSAPVLIYQVWLTRSDPILAAWNAQNMTLSVWELLIAYSPILLVAIPGCYFVIKSGEQSMRTLLLWAGLGLLLLYVPWSLQRRFISGYMIPLAGLAAITMDRVFSRKKVVGVASLALLIVLMIPTNLMIILGGMQAVENKDENIYLTDDEYHGLMWIESNTSEEAVVLAGPEMGLLIPAYTGRRVWYGHPFETPDAERMETRVLDFFSGTTSTAVTRPCSRILITFISEPGSMAWVILTWELNTSWYSNLVIRAFIKLISVLQGQKYVSRADQLRRID